MIHTFGLFVWMALSCVIAFGADVSVTDSNGNQIVVNDSSRIVAVGGDITEIIYALGAKEQLVARDTTSYFPDEVESLPDVGYMRTLSPEGILAMEPSVILAVQGSGPETSIKQLRDAGVPLVMIGRGESIEAVEKKISLIAKAIHKVEAGKVLVEKLDAEYKEFQKSLKKITGKPKVLFLMNAQRGTLLAAGEKTGADVMISMAGGVNAVKGFIGYKAISTEAAVQAMPDVIVIPSHGAERVGGTEGLSSMPELKNTPAVKNNKVVQFDSLYLLMFGPRFVYAAAELADIMHDGYIKPEMFQAKEKSE